MSWGSFVIGTVVGGFFCGLVGLVLGKAISTPSFSLEVFTRLILAKLEKNHNLCIHTTIAHTDFSDSDDDGSDEDDEDSPSPYARHDDDEFWRGN